MKSTLAFSTLLTALTFSCGASQNNSAELAAVAQVNVEPMMAVRSNGPLTCTIQTVKGRYLTAVGGGNRTSDVLHTDAVRASTWEKFKLIDSGDGTSPINYGIQTMDGHFLTAVGGGGRITDVIHSNAVRLQAWERFQLYSLGGGQYAIRTNNGHFLTATGGGGQIVDAIHSDATRIDSWEKFRFSCTYP